MIVLLSFQMFSHGVYWYFVGHVTKLDSGKYWSNVKLCKIRYIEAAQSLYMYLVWEAIFKTAFQFFSN